MSDAVLECPTETTQPDWVKAKTLYMSNIPAKEIAAQAGVSLLSLNKRIVRQGWSKLRRETREAVSHEAKKIVTVVTKTTSVGDYSLQNAANRFRTGLVKRFDKALETLDGTDAPDSLKAIQREHESLRPLVENARTILGLDAQAVSTLLSVSRLEGAGESKVMDVQSQAVPAAPCTVQEQACLAVPVLPEQTG